MCVFKFQVTKNDLKTFGWARWNKNGGTFLLLRFGFNETHHCPPWAKQLLLKIGTLSVWCSKNYFIVVKTHDLFNDIKTYNM